jgi:hypothetical protein
MVTYGSISKITHYYLSRGCGGMTQRGGALKLARCPAAGLAGPQWRGDKWQDAQCRGRPSAGA